MPGQKTVWGIDVGQFALRGLKLRLQGEGAEVVAFDVVEYPHLLSQPDVNADELMAEAVEKFASRNDLRGSAVVLGVPGQQTFTRFTKLPPVEPKKIGSIVTYEAQQQIPFDIDEVIWDYQTFQTPDSPEVEVGIFAIRRDLVRKYLSVFTDRGIEPVLVQASPLALYNYLAFDEIPTEGAVVILDVGAQNTDLVVARKDGAWTRNIPLGGNNFTDALVKSFKLSFGKAEALKRTAASSRYARQIFQAMRPVFADLVAEIQRSLGFYNSTHRDVEIVKILGMGNAFKLPGLQKYLQQNLQTEVDRLTNFKKLQLSSGLNAASFNESVMSMGVAYGLAIQGLDAGMINNSLLPVEIARAMLWRRKTPWFAGAAATILVGALALVYSKARYASALAQTEAPGYNTTISSVEMANDIVMKGASDAPTGRARAEKIQAAAQKLKQALDTEKAKGQEQGALTQMIELNKDRTLWIELVSKIHQTVPKPPEVEAAKTIDEYIAALKQIPRQQRQMVYIDGIEAGYVSDTGAAFETGSVQNSGSDRSGGRGQEPSRGESGGGVISSGPTGFMLLIKGHTPMGPQGQAVVFLSEWVKHLKAIKGETVAFHVGKIDERPEALPVVGRSAGMNTAVALPPLWMPPVAALSMRSTAQGPTLGGSYGGYQSSGDGGRDGGRSGGRGEDPGRGGGRGEDPGRGGGRGEEPGRGGGRGEEPGRGAGAMPSYSATGSTTMSLRDPLLTDESIASDYAFTIRMTVVMGEEGDVPDVVAPPVSTSRERDRRRD